MLAKSVDLVTMEDMLSAWERHLPLVFHEDGYDEVYAIKIDRYHSEPNPQRTGKLIPVSEGDKPKFKLDASGELGDAGLYAAFTAFRTGGVVSLEWNNVNLQVDGTQTEVDDSQIPGNLREALDSRFEDIAGADDLTDDDRFTIGCLCVALERDYDAQIHSGV